MGDLNHSTTEWQTIATTVFPGLTYTKMSSFANRINLQFWGESAFYFIQDAYIFHVINQAWGIRWRKLRVSLLYYRAVMSG
jgi:hypothetical protein